MILREGERSPCDTQPLIAGGQANRRKVQRTLAIIPFLLRPLFATAFLLRYIGNESDCGKPPVHLSNVLLCDRNNPE